MEKSREDIGAALLIFTIGLATTIGSFNYSIGSLNSMGPGYFPLILGCTLLFLSFFLFLKGYKLHLIEKEKDESYSFFKFGKVDKSRWRVWALVSLAMVSFVLLSLYVGFLAASFSIVFISALADRGNSIKSILIFSACLTAFVVGIFYYLLGIQIPLWQ